MKVVLGNESVISTSNLKENLVYVGISGDSSPCILVNSDYEGAEYSFRVLNEEFTVGNSYEEYPTLRQAVEAFIRVGGEVEAFEKWKDALKWLVNS